MDDKLEQMLIEELRYQRRQHDELAKKIALINEELISVKTKISLFASLSGILSGSAVSIAIHYISILQSQN